MRSRDPPAARSRYGRLVHQAHAGALQRRECRIEILDDETVVEALPRFDRARSEPRIDRSDELEMRPPTSKNATRAPSDGTVSMRSQEARASPQRATACQIQTPIAM